MKGDVLDKMSRVQRLRLTGELQAFSIGWKGLTRNGQNPGEGKMGESKVLARELIVVNSIPYPNP